MKVVVMAYLCKGVLLIVLRFTLRGDDSNKTGHR